jgi:hypothetical protein
MVCPQQEGWHEGWGKAAETDVCQLFRVDYYQLIDSWHMFQRRLTALHSSVVLKTDQSLIETMKLLQLLCVSLAPVVFANPALRASRDLVSYLAHFSSSYKIAGLSFFPDLLSEIT